MKSGKLKIAFVWQFAQPYLKDLNGNYTLSVIRQHLQRDYIDMLKIAKHYPKLKQTFNFVPALLDQLDDYVTGEATDYTWFLSHKKADELQSHEKEFILKHFFKGENESIIFPYDRYMELYEKKINLLEKGYIEDITPVFSQEEYRDLQIWHNLAWIGIESQKAPLIQKLLKKQRNFSEEDKYDLFEFLRSLHHSFFDVYKDHIENNEIEISTTPYYNPVLPIIIDNHSVQTSKSLPLNRFKGSKYAKWQLIEARKRVKKEFNQTSTGIILHDFIIDAKSLQFISKLRFDWTVIDNSYIDKTTPEYYPVSYSEKDNYHLRCFIKNNELVDLFNNEFSTLPVKSSLKLFKQYLNNYRKKIFDEDGSIEEAIITIPLKGDTLWNKYYGNGSELLHGIYQFLDKSDMFETVRMQDYLEEFPEDNRIIKSIKKAKTEYFDRWIGSPATNRAWDKIYWTHEFIKTVEESGEISQNTVDKAKKQFHIALGAEWFEWYSGNESQWDIFYDELFRSHLIRCYEDLIEKPPKALFYNLKNDNSYIFKSLPVTSLIHPDIDGYDTGFTEWHGAAVYDAQKQQMEIGNFANEFIRYIGLGYDEENIYFSVRFNKYPPMSTHIVFDFLVPDGFSLHVIPFTDQIRLIHTDESEYRLIATDIAFEINEILEIKLPVKYINLEKNRIFALQVCLLKKDVCFERFPQTSVIRTRFMDEAIIGLNS